MVDHSQMKLGKKPPVYDRKELRLANYLTGLPSPPASLDYSTKLQNLGMMLNDSLGDCLIGDTFAVTPGLLKAYRARYSGPILRIKTSTGKRLTATRNHHVLTTNGFIPMWRLQKGDQVISTDFPETVALGPSDNLNKSPITIKDLFETNQRRNSVSSVSRQVSAPVDFHGDARNFKGKIDVVNSDSFLESANIAAFSHPKRQQRFVSMGRHSVSFDSLRSTGTHNRTVFPSASSGLGLGRVSLPLFDSEFAGSEKAGFFKRAHLSASPSYSRLKPLASDVKLCGEFVQSFPGLITFDDIVDIEDQWLVNEHVYDLSTEKNWYIANGIVTHNCTCAAVGHMIQTWTSLTRPQQVILPDTDILNLYEQSCGYVPGDPSTDQGGEENAVLRYWRNSGIFPGNTLAGWCSVQPGNHTEVKQCLYLFGAVYIGIDLPITAQSQDVWDVVSTTGQGAPGSWGGHAVPVVAYDDQTLTVITWGMLKKMTWAFWDAYVDEAHGPLSADWIENGSTPSGQYWTHLKADLLAIGQ